MNWIILIIAGCCETGFTFCLGKAKDAVGTGWWLWMGGFLLFTILSMGLLAKATQTIPIGSIAILLLASALGVALPYLLAQ